MVGTHLGCGDANRSIFLWLRGDRIHSRRAAGSEFAGSGLVEPTELLLLVVAELQNGPSDVFLCSKDTNLSAKSCFDRAGIRAKEFRSARCDFALFDRVVQRQVMPFEPPAPGAGLGRCAEDAEVVFLRIAFLAALRAIASFEQVQHLFQAHHVECLVVTSSTQPALNQPVCGLERGTFKLLDRQAVSRTWNEVPVEPLLVIEREACLFLLLGGQRADERLRGGGHLRARSGFGLKVRGEQGSHRDQHGGRQSKFASAHQESPLFSWGTFPTCHGLTGTLKTCPTESPRRPMECSAAEEVNVQVIDRLAAVSAAVDDGAISVRQTELLGHFLRRQQQVAEQGLIVRLSSSEVGNLLLGDHQHMRRSLRRDVVKRQTQLVFMDDLGWDFFVDDPLKDGRHRRLGSLFVGQLGTRGTVSNRLSFGE